MNEAPRKIVSSPEHMKVRGSYESYETDTYQLAAELASGQDLDRLVNDFDKGSTYLREVGGMCVLERDGILETYEDGRLNEFVRELPELVEKPVRNLHKRISSGDDNQKVGYNFFCKARNLLPYKDQVPGLDDLDTLIRRKYRVGVFELGNMIAVEKNYATADSLLGQITNLTDLEMTKIVAVYLAGISKVGEQILERSYGEVLRKAKDDTRLSVTNIGRITGLKPEALGRVLAQIDRATFGSYDHLDGMVTTGNSGALGDYQGGTLRLEVHMKGDAGSPKARTPQEVLSIISHELHHAASAQSVEARRIGLKSIGGGLEANEGMTEFLSQISSGFEVLTRNENGSYSIREDLPYAIPTSTIAILYQQYLSGFNNHFAILFNAYHGDADSVDELRKALDAFYVKNNEKLALTRTASNH